MKKYIGILLSLLSVGPLLALCGVRSLFWIKVSIMTTFAGCAMFALLLLSFLFTRHK